jgi:hypothetical protein
VKLVGRVGDSDCDERGGKTIVNGRFRAVCMKTVLQYVTYSTDDPTAAFLWVRARVQVATSSSSTCGVGQRWRYGSTPCSTGTPPAHRSYPGSRLTYQPQLDTSAEVLDCSETGAPPSELCDVLRIAQTDRDQLPCEGAVDLLGVPLAWSTRTASFVHARWPHAVQGRPEARVRPSTGARRCRWPAMDARLSQTAKPCGHVNYGGGGGRVALQSGRQACGHSPTTPLRVCQRRGCGR